MRIYFEPFTYYLAELSANQCCAIAAHLVNSCAWFQYIPLPYDRGRIIVKNEYDVITLVRHFSPPRSIFLTTKQFKEHFPA